MENAYKIGDIVKPKPNYERCSHICDQNCKRHCEKSWLYHLFKTAEIIFIHESGNVDLSYNGGGICYDIPFEMLEKVVK